MKRISLVSLALFVLLALFLGCEEDTVTDTPGPTGTLVFNAEPDSLNAPWTLTGPDKATLSGVGDRTLTAQPLGEYTLQWGEVEGWQSMACAVHIPRTLTADDTLTWYALYTEVPTTGTLNVSVTVGDGLATPAGDKAVRTLDIIDIYHTLHSMYVSTDTIVDGQPDDLEWEPILTDGVVGYDSDLDISVELPPGQYKCMKMLSSNALKWVCTDGVATYEFPDWNAGESGPDQLWNIFSTAGLYGYDQDETFALQNTSERIGTVFEIVAGETTTVTIRSNFNTLDWIDDDDSGDWSDGDGLDDWTTIPGTDTMVDFIVVNPL